MDSNRGFLWVLLSGPFCSSSSPPDILNSLPFTPAAVVCSRPDAVYCVSLQPPLVCYDCFPVLSQFIRKLLSLTLQPGFSLCMNPWEMSAFSRRTSSPCPMCLPVINFSSPDPVRGLNHTGSACRVRFESFLCFCSQTRNNVQNVLQRFCHRESCGICQVPTWVHAVTYSSPAAWCTSEHPWGSSLNPWDTTELMLVWKQRERTESRWEAKHRQLLIIRFKHR